MTDEEVEAAMKEAITSAQVHCPTCNSTNVALLQSQGQMECQHCKLRCVSPEGLWLTKDTLLMTVEVTRQLTQAQFRATTYIAHLRSSDHNCTHTEEELFAAPPKAPPAASAGFGRGRRHGE